MAKDVTKAVADPAGIINPNQYYSNQSSDGSDLNELDLVARYILAMTHTELTTEFDATNTTLAAFPGGAPKGQKEYTKDGLSETEINKKLAKQNITGLKTVVVGVSGHTMYVTHNGAFLKPTPSEEIKGKVKQLVLDYLADSLYRKVTNVEVINLATNKMATTFHAEMQLFAYLCQNGLPLDGRMIGVSKPCCSQCANFLTSQGIIYSLKTAEPMGQWLVPGDYTGGTLTTNNLAPL